ncbi:MAG: SUMF1/EgtB/PvdO family nonheme iron enzyme [Saprospiraceae bacterium]|nr:SUMF1/EgtB/PvdO family nonheme iron enzyme [Saprospiraceae bacterium]
MDNKITENHPQTFKDSPLAFNMIAIEGGTFDMGSEDYADEKPVHKVTLTDYWLCEHPVTQAVWEYIMGSNPSHFKGANRPVENVSWDDIADKKNVNNFLSKLNKDTEGSRPPRTEYRLPTEAQWEYAAKGGKYWRAYPFEYSGSDKLNEVGWYDENSHNETKPVGLKTPNLLGLYDMSGNVWEWCADWYDSDFYEKCEKQGTVENPCNDVEGSNRVFRGGSYFHDAQYCRPTYRSNYTPSIRNFDIGFRLGLFFLSV